MAELDDLAWADEDLPRDYAEVLEELGREWGAVVRERADQVGRAAVLAELLEAFGVDL